jgi:cytochrome P450
MNLGHEEPFGILRLALIVPDRALYAVIRERRRAADLEGRTDIMSLIMRARTEEGNGLDDRALRDELMTLVLAGHETTAHQLAWTFERLVRNPSALERLTAAVREGAEDAEALIEATLNESMRTRPVIPIIGRRVQAPWRLGDYGIPADTAVAVSIVLVHHREDVYPDPFSFRPERWLESKPGTYELIPFGGGTRRCLGAALAMAEMRVVLRKMVERLDIAAPGSGPERPLHRNVTMLPSRGGRVVIRARTAAA